MFDLSGKTAIVTGGAGILGIEAVRALLANGAAVIMVDRRQDLLDKAMDEIAAPDGRLHGYCADITDGAAVTDLRAAIESAHGTVDILVNNAAAKSANFFDPFESFPRADWDEVMGVNLTGAFLCAQQFGGAMAERGAGTIVNILSVYGIAGPDQRIYEGSEYEGRAINTPAIYSASKAGLWGLTQYLATFWGSRGVRVNAVTPGGVFSGQNDVFVQRYSQRVPLGRMAERHEMAGAIAFLASDAASYITGHNLVVDGGLTAW